MSSAEMLRVPLIDRGKEIGQLALGPRRDGREYLPAEREALSQAASAIAAALRLSQQASHFAIPEPESGAGSHVGV